MTTVRWSPEAAVDFAGILEYIRIQNPAASDRVARSVYDSVTSLEKFPARGRQGKITGTRELVLTPLPFVVIYSFKGSFVEIARILHGSQRWP